MTFQSFLNLYSGGRGFIFVIYWVYHKVVFDKYSNRHVYFVSLLLFTVYFSTIVRKIDR